MIAYRPAPTIEDHEVRAAALAVEQGQRGRCLDFEPVRLDVIARTAHDGGAVLLYRPQGGFTVMSPPPPGDDLPSWPAVQL